MADFFTKDLNIEEDYTYTYGEGPGAVTCRLRGVAREFGQTTLGKGDGTGLTIWRGAEELCRYLWPRREELTGLRCLELGAGLGLVGLLLARLDVGCNVVTDGDVPTCDRIASNALRNGLAPASPADEDGAWSAAGSGAWSLSARHFRCCGGEGGGEGGKEGGGASDSDDEGGSEGNRSDGASASCAEPAGRAALSITRLLWCDPSDMAKAHRLAATNALISRGGGECSGGDGDSGDKDDGEDRGGRDDGKYDLVLAADVVYEVGAVVPLVATVCALLRRAPSARWLLSFARRNVPVHLVIAEAASKGLSCAKVTGFECATSGENIFELRWADTDVRPKALSGQSPPLPGQAVSCGALGSG